MGTAPSQLLCQLIFHGKTSRSLPTCEIPANIKVTVSENHWSTLATMDEVMGDIDHIMNPAGTREPWLLLLDVCPIHVSKQYRSMVRDRYEHVRLAFVPPGTTCVAQPLDVGMMRLFKSGLREAAAADMSRMLLDAVVDNQPDLHKTMKNALLKRKIVGWIEVALHSRRRGGMSSQPRPRREYRASVFISLESMDHGAWPFFVGEPFETEPNLSQPSVFFFARSTRCHLTVFLEVHMCFNPVRVFAI